MCVLYVCVCVYVWQSVSALALGGGRCQEKRGMAVVVAWASGGLCAWRNGTKWRGCREGKKGAKEVIERASRRREGVKRKARDRAPGA